jgi:hypothetical protein
MMSRAAKLSSRINTKITRAWQWIAVPLLMLGAFAAFIAFDRKVPVVDLTVPGKAVVVITGFAAGIASIFLLAALSQSGSVFQEWTYMRQTRHKKWLSHLIMTAALIGVVASIFARGLMGHVVRWLPVQEYTTLQVRVLERSRQDGGLFECKEEVTVLSEDANRHTLCLESGSWWASVPGRLRDVKAGDAVVVRLRRTVLGSGAEITELTAPGQKYFVE